MSGRWAQYFGRAALAYGLPRSSRTLPRVARAMSVFAAGAAGSTLAAPLSLEAPVERAVQDPATSLSLPAEMKLDDGRTLRLVGLGVRSVTFIGIRVYVAGVYVDERAVQEPRTVPEDLETLFARWIEDGVACAVRIMPVRGTDFGHLRDGLVRAVNVRAKDARKPESAYALTELAEERLARNVRDLKALFPRGSVPKGQHLDLVVERGAERGTYVLALRYDHQPLGTVTCVLPADGPRAFALPMHLVLAYVGARPGISAPLREAVARGVHEQLP